MPTYQYACTECDHSFEQQQSFSDDSLTECPACEGRLRKLFNAVGVVFKGSGFYRTDSRAAAASSLPASEGGSSSEKSGSSGEKSGSTGTSAGTSTGAEKPAAKAAAKPAVAAASSSSD